MSIGKRLAGIFKDIFIEIFVFLLFNLRFSSRPKRFIFIYNFKLNSLNWSCDGSIDRIFNLFFIDLFSLLFPFLCNFLNLCFNFCFSLFYFLLSSHYLFQINRICDEAAVSLNETLEFVVFTVFTGIFFKI